jgi:hypothetical protein
VAQILQRLPRRLLCGGRISGLLQKTRSRLLEERLRSRIEQIQGLAQPQAMNGLRQRRAPRPPSLRSRLDNPTAAPRNTGGV